MTLEFEKKASLLLGFIFGFFLFLFLLLNNIYASTVGKNSNKILLKTTAGEFVIVLLPTSAPNHVQRVKKLVREGRYDGVSFSRVIDGFVAQLDCNKSDDLEPMNAELTMVYGHKKGVLAMARDPELNSAKCGMFITLADRSELDGNYTILGYVESGELDKIRRGDIKKDGLVKDPSIIMEAKLLSDVKSK